MSSAKRRRTDRTFFQQLDEFDLASLACARCRTRKVKCGGEFPSCVGCEKANVPCIIADPTAPRDYTREEVQSLYDKMLRLEASLSQGPGEPQSPSGTPGSQRGESRFVGQENTFRLVSSLFPPTPSPTTAAGLGHRRRQPPKSRAFYHAPHRFPSRDVALAALNEFFGIDHVLHPLLESTKVYATLDQQQPLESSTSQDVVDKTALFQLYMAMAIGSVRLFRSGALALHPFGFLTAALEVKPPSTSSFSNVDDVENLLLIAKFGTFYDIGCSVWELGRLCIRIAVELGIHRQAVPSLDEADAVRCSRVFWTAYLLDRSSSSTLGRPFAINDACITAELSKADETGSLVFNWLVGLGRIASEIRTTVQDRTAADDSGDTVSQLLDLHRRLVAWRSNAPITDAPTSLAEASQFFDLSYQEVRLGLLRSSVDKLHLDQFGPPRSLVRPCLQAACSIITSFDHLRRHGLVTYTRAYTHLIFVASLVVLSMVRAKVDEQVVGTYEDDGDDGAEVDVGHWLSSLDDGSFHVSSESARETIAIAGNLLAWFAENMPDMAVCQRFFEDTRKSLGPPATTTNLNQGRPVATVSDTANKTAPTADVVEDFWTEGQPDFPAAQDPSHVTFPAPAAPVYDLSDVPGYTASFAASYDFAPYHEVNTFSWPFSDMQGVEQLDASLSGYIWDTVVPWQGSPSASIESHGG